MSDTGLPWRLTGIGVGILAPFLVGYLILVFGGQESLAVAGFGLMILIEIIHHIFLSSGERHQFNISFPERERETQLIKMPPDDLIDWESLTPRERYEKIAADPEWPPEDDSNYESKRNLGSSVLDMSTTLKNTRYLDSRRLRALIDVIIVIGGIWFILLLTELLGSTTTQYGLINTISRISPIKASTSNIPIYQFIVSVALFAIPLGYLEVKQTTTCPECQSPFALESKGKYSSLKLKETRRQNNETYEIRRGRWYFQCESCGEFVEEDWEVREQINSNPSRQR